MAGRCATEFIGFSNLHDDFVKRNVQLIGLSIDSVSTIKASCASSPSVAQLEERKKAGYEMTDWYFSKKRI